MDLNRFLILFFPETPHTLTWDPKAYSDSENLSMSNIFYFGHIRIP